MAVADMPMLKPKLSIHEQVVYMREKLGITFQYVTEEQAEHFLTEHTYFYKLKSYARNYDKNTAGEYKGQYSRLDFSYLQELSVLDKHLREIVLDMTIDIEHYLKVKLLRDLSENDKEDGYRIVQEFFEINPYAKAQIEKKAASSACSELIAHNHGCFSVWQVVEIMSFGSFTELFFFYYARYPDKSNTALRNAITPVRFLRNAAAHNNGLLRNLRSNVGEHRKNKQISSLISKELSRKGFQISSKSFNNKMSNRIIHDFVCMLFVFNSAVTSEVIKERSMKRLKNLFQERFLRHKEYFQGNEIICSAYQFVKKVIDIYEE